MLELADKTNSCCVFYEVLLSELVARCADGASAVLTNEAQCILGASPQASVLPITRDVSPCSRPAANFLHPKRLRTLCETFSGSEAPRTHFPYGVNDRQSIHLDTSLLFNPRATHI